MSAIIASGCSGITSAKVNSVASAADTSNSSYSAVLSASPAAIEFGTVPVGATMNQSLTVTNSGTAPATISQVTASGSGFTMSGVPLPATLNSGASVTFSASFDPSATGDASGSISFMDQQLRRVFGVGWHGIGKAVSPSISAQPASQSILAGQTATFSVTSSGTAPLSYQWSKNGAGITGATSSTYTTPAETASDNGAQFSVLVSNAAGSANSAAATLSVSNSAVAPSITTPPANQTVFAGQTATFSVVTNGTSPLSYQWRKNGVTITGAASASYTTPAETTSDSGALFSVVVSNSAGNATSNSATLTVDPVPPGALTPSTATLTFGNVVVSNSSALGVTFKNSGTVNITVSTVTISGAGFTASGVSNGQIITPGQVVTLNLTFAPATTGSSSGGVTIGSDASNSPVSVSLSGFGVLAHSATLNWTSRASTVIGYNVYSGTVSGGPYVLVTSSLISGTQYVDSTVLSGQTYYYVATAVASGSVESTYSNEVSAAIPTP